ncbi:MAG: beta-N-acetylhexosaminidase [Clostridiales bacterium]|nr:beta-N-acetylhexosaminidase [Clostridiales bacterium]
MIELIPQPKEYCEDAGQSVCLAGRHIAVPLQCDIRIVAAAQELSKDLSRLSGKFVAVYQRPAKPGEIEITLSGGKEDDEAYELIVKQEIVRLSGKGMRGVYYAIVTLRQILDQQNGVTLPAFTLSDRPDFPNRVFYQDISRGRVPHVKTLKRLCDTLSMLKINSLQLYLEDAFPFLELDGEMHAGETLSAAQIMELDQYCWMHFVELVPSVSCFGHLYRLLQSKKYQYLCELEGYQPQNMYWIEKMAHHTINPSHPNARLTVFSMIDQTIGLCRSKKFNICCDETFDLGRGKNAGRDVGALYFDFVSQLVQHVQSSGKEVMMWGDIVLHHPEKIANLPANITFLNWCYDPQVPVKDIDLFTRLGCKQYVCAGTSTWNRFIGNDACAAENICNMAKEGYRRGACGFMNTNWGDYGNICSLTGAMLEMAVGAEAGWNAETTHMDDAFDRSFSRQLFGVRNDNMADLMREISMLEEHVDWKHVVEWYNASYVRKDPHTARYFEADVKMCQAHIQSCHKLYQTLENLGRGNKKINDLYVAVGGIEMLHTFALRQNGEQSSVGKFDVEMWLDAMRRAWKDDSYAFGFEQIERFVQSLWSLPAFHDEVLQEFMTV